MSEAKKYDQGKPQLSLNPTEALNEMARAFEYGMKKYGRNNFKKGHAWTRCIDATLRHTMAFSHGEDNDPESGYSHIAHALASLAMLSYHMVNHPELDDRKPEEKETSQVVRSKK
jgi:Domain of unknown function (DUF5664)